MTGTTDALKIVVVGDLHVTEDAVAPFKEMFAEMSRTADAVVLCGDLTNLGKTSEAEILAEDLQACEVPVLGVLGNHDFHCNQPEKVAEILRQAGMIVLDEQAVELHGVGFAGVKGFMGGFGRGEIHNFGERPIKSFTQVALDEARKLENALRTIRADRALAVLHYAPVVDTLAGEPPEIHQYLGSQRLADAIDRFDFVTAAVHGHAHHGTHRGRTRRGIPVYNCAQPVLRRELGRSFALLEI
jgi:Icc-related predicted phosphoesterase